MEIVIGYLSHFTNDLLKFHDIGSDELIGAKFEMVYNGESDDIIKQLLTENYGLCVSFDKETNNATIMLQHEVPLEYFKVLYNNTPILKS